MIRQDSLVSKRFQFSQNVSHLIFDVYELDATLQEYNEDGKGLMFPIANPILTCASVVDPSHPSTFVADPFLYMQV